MVFEDIISSFFLAASLCADCFAVTSCSSTSLGKIDLRKAAPVALSFGIIQTLLMAAGWLFGGLFVGIVEKVAHLIGFLLLLYVGGSMILDSLKKSEGAGRNLTGFVNVLVGGVASSIDAFAVGIGLCMDGCSREKVGMDLIMVFAVTIVSSLLGMYGGSRAGQKFGRPAEAVGGCILILIGILQ